jgi:L-rhamnose isomerase
MITSAFGARLGCLGQIAHRLVLKDCSPEKDTRMTERLEALVHHALDSFNVELPSWGFANTGTRFGKFIQLATAVTVEDKFSDAGQVHALTGACPTVALHVQWGLPNGLKDVAQVKRLAEKYGVQPGSINPNVFQDQEYKYGSEAMIQTVCTAQELYAKAAIVDRARLAPLQQSCSLVEAEETLRGAFWYDVRPVLREWRRGHGLPEDPMQAFREGGYLERITAERKERNAVSVTSYA